MTNTKRYEVQDRETGTVIDDFDTLQEAEEVIEDFDAEDEKDGIFTPNFYKIWDTITEEEAN